MLELETADWPRYGVKGAATHLDGRGDFCNMFLIEIPAGRSTLPQRHLYEEVIYVLEGRGSTQVEFEGGAKRSFEWGPNSLFAIPLNAKHRHFNASGTSRARLTSTTDLPILMNIFHHEGFLFGVDFSFEDRVGKDEYYTGEGELYAQRHPGNSNVWESNFVTDVASIPLTNQSDRGADGTGLVFVLADGSLHAHISEMPQGTYKKAHRHDAGAHVMCVAGSGYSLLWYEGGEFQRVDWKPGTVFPPAARQFHQHFTTSDEPARYLATMMGSIRHPVTQAQMLSMVGKPGEKPAMSLSLKDGGDQVEYADQDPRIHTMWLEEMKKHKLAPRMEKFIKS